MANLLDPAATVGDTPPVAAERWPKPALVLQASSAFLAKSLVTADKKPALIIQMRDFHAFENRSRVANSTRQRKVQGET